jgi:hypothetical protein
MAASPLQQPGPSVLYWALPCCSPPLLEQGLGVNLSSPAADMAVALLSVVLVMGFPVEQGHRSA